MCASALSHFHLELDAQSLSSLRPIRAHVVSGEHVRTSVASVTRHLTTQMSVTSDGAQCPKRPSTESKETYYSVKRDLLQCQKRPMSVASDGAQDALLCTLLHGKTCTRLSLKP